MANRSFIGFGSNIGDRLEYINRALELLGESATCGVIKVSSIYETKPYGFTEQNNFLNCVAEVTTEHNLFELLSLTKSIEKKIGRQKREKWGPREVDLDILFFNTEIYSDDKVTIPHKDILKRDFVLVPLCEIAPDFIHPVEKIRICKLLENGIENNIIRKLEYNFI